MAIPVMAASTHAVTEVDRVKEAEEGCFSGTIYDRMGGRPDESRQSDRRDAPGEGGGPRTK